ncbi:tautomerase family protein [Sulfuricaulis sp.]|uniref:tautomerase family protein n=1 Tax=Sulfuricaulis sp. TaxID=2003553 RepID=UPI003C707C98
MKKALYKAIAGSLQKLIGLKPQDVFISLVEVKKRKLVVRERRGSVRRLDILRPELVAFQLAVKRALVDAHDVRDDPAVTVVLLQ